MASSNPPFDALPAAGNRYGQAYRDRGLEEEVLELTRGLGIGAQFGGKYFCHDVRVIRLPRHGASLPIGIGVSCAADRQILGEHLPALGDDVRRRVRAGIALGAGRGRKARLVVGEDEARAERPTGLEVDHGDVSPHDQPVLGPACLPSLPVG